MTIGVTQLGYLGVNSTAPAVWREFGTHIGAEIVEQPSGDFGFRLDSDRAARFFVHPSDSDALSYVGWQVAGPGEFDETATRLEKYGAQVVDRPDLAEERGCRGLATFTDPDGNPSELYWGMSTAIRTQFVSPYGVDFATGGMGMGHITLAVEDFGRTHDFYTNALGMRLSEIADVGEARVGFLRCNPRHHSVAFVEPPAGGARVLHVAIEVQELDSLGSIRDRMLDVGFPIARDLGRHPTDGVISMYLRFSDAFEIELGWGSILIDDATWEQDRYARTGWTWGHRTLAPSTP